MVNGKLGQFLLLVFLIFMPLEKLIVSGLGPGDLFFITFAVLAWIMIWRNRTKFQFPLAFPMGVIFVGSLIGTLSALDISTAAIAMIQEVYLLLIFVTLVNAIKDRKALQWFVNAWAWVAAVEAPILMLDRVGINLPIIGGGGAKAAALGVTGGGAVGRAVGTFVNANAAGGYMLLTFFVVLAMPVPRNRLLRVTFLLLYVIGLLATGSIGALVGLTVGLSVAGLYWLFRSGRSLLFMIGVATILITLVGLLLPLLSPLLGAHQSIGFQLGVIAHKMDKRLNLWTNDTKLLEEHPLGIGPNVTASEVVIGAHSDYVAFMTERGAIGFIGLFLLFGEVIFWVSLSARDGHKREDYLATAALFGGILGLMAMATVHETTHGRPVWMLFAVAYLNYKFVLAEAVERLPKITLWAGSQLTGLKERFAK